MSPPRETLVCIVSETETNYRLPVPAGCAVICLSDEHGLEIVHTAMLQASTINFSIRRIDEADPANLPLIMAAVPEAALGFWTGLSAGAVSSIVANARAAVAAENHIRTMH